jgi:hypothetical protein
MDWVQLVQDVDQRQVILNMNLKSWVQKWGIYKLV